MFLSENSKGETVQLFATNIGNILCFSFGLMFGITPTHSNLYMTSATPLNRPVDTEGAIWLTGFLFLSAVVGAIFSGFLTEKIGPKSVLYSSGILQIIGWFCIHFAYDIVHIYSSRMFAGVAGGAVLVVLPIYIVEITESSKCSSLLGSIEQCRALGIFIGMTMGAFLPYSLVSIFGICISLIFLLICPFLKESPYYFLRKQNIAAMEQSLRWFRGIRKIEDHQKREFVIELNELRNEIQGRTTIGDIQMSRSYKMKLFSICLTLTVGAQLTGVYIILNDSGRAFGQMYNSSTFTTQNCVLIMALIQILGTTLFRWIGIRIKRKILLILSAMFGGLAMICFGLLRSFSNPTDVISQQAANVYLCLLGLHILFATFGVYPMSLIISIEVTPSKLRTTITTLTTAISHFVLFVLMKYFNEISLVLKDTIGWFYVFGISSLFIASFAFILLPETSAKSSYEVQQAMGYSSNYNIAKITTVTNGRIKNANI